MLAITDHNTARHVDAALKAAQGRGVLLVPGIEISTHDGHLLGLFSPSAVEELQSLAQASNLKLKRVGQTGQRSSRSMLDLMEEIYDRGGLAVPAHIDAKDGMKLGGAELEDMLTSEFLSGLEFTTREALSSWFTDEDQDGARLNSWNKRQANPVLRERGLARLMSSDAHSIDKVGQDRTSRTLTRIRLDDVNFSAVRNAIVFNPKARCKAEVALPAAYPWIKSARFEGGFLDGVELEFSPNLNCLIGGRGSGKSTALLAIRAALGAGTPGENPDAEGRMPDVTEVTFVDVTGSERVTRRVRGQEPEEKGTDSPIRLRLADLGQDESGRLARGYEQSPEMLLDFLDGFVVRHEFDEAEAELVAELADNASEIQRTASFEKELEAQQKDQKRVKAQLDAARKGKVELIAEWAALLATQEPFLKRLGERLTASAVLDVEEPLPDLDTLARDFHLDLQNTTAKPFVEGEEGLRTQLEELAATHKATIDTAEKALKEATQPSAKTVERWKEKQAELQERLAKKREELKAQGLDLQAGIVENLAKRLNELNESIENLKKRKVAHHAARTARIHLLGRLRSNRDRLHQTRASNLKSIAQSATRSADELEIQVTFQQEGMKRPWVEWLGQSFGFRAPRVYRLADRISPTEFASALIAGDTAKLLAIQDENGEAFFSDASVLESVRSWPVIFKLETMRLEDRPRLQIREPGSSTPKELDQLSAGQQRSALLSLLLCADRNEPLVLDQPEDHLDAEYIASGVVRHLEAAKERRQILLATHSPNLTVLGDAELVIPMRMQDGHGEPHDEGAVDRPVTRDRVCDLLEGGASAYKKRGQRYGFAFKADPA